MWSDVWYMCMFVRWGLVIKIVGWFICVLCGFLYLNVYYVLGIWILFLIGVFFLFVFVLVKLLKICWWCEILDEYVWFR